MTIYDIRRKNLRNLMNDLFEGRQVELANALERSPSYISRILSTHSSAASQSNRNIGEELARDIETRLHLPCYSLDYAADQSRPVGIEEPRRAYQTRIYDSVSEEHRRCVDNVANTLLRLDADQAHGVERALRLLLRIRRETE